MISRSGAGGGAGRKTKLGEGKKFRQVEHRNKDGWALSLAAVHWLGLSAFTAVTIGSILGQGSKTP